MTNIPHIGRIDYPSYENSYEEFFLRQFFGPRYVEYALRVPSGLPFIK